MLASHARLQTLLRANDDKSERKIIKKFPNTMAHSFGDEKTRLLPKETKNLEFYEEILSYDQFRDQYEAVKFAENNFLTLQLNEITGPVLLNFIKKLQRICASSLMMAKCDYSTPGEFNKQPIYSLRETGLEEEYAHAYEEKAKERNIALVKKLHGNKTAKLYAEFYEQMEKEAQEKKPNFELIPFVTKIKQEKPQLYKAACCVFRFFPDPASVPELMQEFTEKLAKKMQAQTDPIECAAFAYTLVSIHPFAYVHKRTARIFYNSILMMMGMPAMPIPKSDCRAFNLAFEACTKDNLLPLIHFMNKWKKEHSHFSNIPNLIDEPENDPTMSDVENKILLSFLGLTAFLKIESKTKEITFHKDCYQIVNIETKEEKRLDASFFENTAHQFLKEQKIQAAYYFYRRAAYFYQQANNTAASQKMKMKADKLHEQLTPHLYPLSTRLRKASANQLLLEPMVVEPFEELIAYKKLVKECFEQKLINEGSPSTGQTALHLAIRIANAAKGNLLLQYKARIQILLDAGADLDQEDLSHIKPRDLATNADLKKFLTQRFASIRRDEGGQLRFT